MIRLTILHTNDLHGRVQQLTRIAGLVRAIRHQVVTEGGYCLYLDGGDCEDASLLECSLTKGSSMDAILNAAGCDAAVLGNAIPLRYGYQAIANVAQSFGRPLLCANLLDERGEQIEGLDPYRILKLGDLQLGIIGLTADIDSYKTTFHLHVLRPQNVLPGLIDQVRQQGVKTVFLLTHIASLKDIKLAETITGIDMIIGGHDHKILYPPREVKGCIVAQAGQYGEYLGRLDLEIDPETGKIMNYQAILISVGAELPEDETALKAVQREHERADELMRKVIGRVELPLDLAVDRECTAGDLLADALLERIPDAQFAITLAGHWLTGLPAGAITQGGIFAANRSTANPARVILTGEQILVLLKEALKPEKAARILARELRGGFVGLPHVAGLQLEWDGGSVDTLKVFYQGEALNPEQTYIVAATDMEFADFIGYLPVEVEAIQYEIPTIVPKVLQDYITRHSPIQTIDNHRIRIKS